MLTALSDDTDRRIYGELGATWLISKPFDVVQLPNSGLVRLGLLAPSSPVRLRFGYAVSRVSNSPVTATLRVVPVFPHFNQLHQRPSS